MYSSLCIEEDVNDQDEELMEAEVDVEEEEESDMELNEEEKAEFNVSKYIFGLISSILISHNGFSNLFPVTILWGLRKNIKFVGKITKKGRGSESKVPLLFL